MTGLTFQDTVFALKKYWSDRACIIQEPYDVEVGAGTMAPETFLRVLGPKPYRVAYVQPSRRPPADGRYGENPRSPLQAPAAPGDPEAIASRRPRSIPRQPQGHRHRP